MKLWTIERCPFQKVVYARGSRVFLQFSVPVKCPDNYMVEVVVMGVIVVMVCVRACY